MMPLRCMALAKSALTVTSVPGWSGISLWPYLALDLVEHSSTLEICITGSLDQRVGIFVLRSLESIKPESRGRQEVERVEAAKPT